MQIHRLETLGIGVYPTPLERMPRLETELKGPKLFVKREDMTGLAMGGNKVRQLDYILVEAKKKKADYVITTCGIQSNWSRQTVAMATRLGMKAELVLRTAQFKGKPRVLDGNTLLDHIMGAEIKFVKMKISGDPGEILESEAERLRKAGHNPIVLGLPASVSPLGTAAYVSAVEELEKQTGALGISLDAIVVAVSAGPTQGGLALGTKIFGKKTKVIGINVGAYKGDWIRKTMLGSAEGAAKLLGSAVNLASSDVIVREEYAGEDYGIPTKGSINALTLVARKEGLILDPVYTSKAMAGMIDMAKSGEFKKDDNVCFVHTGGVPALFPYREHFQPR